MSSLAAQWHRYRGALLDREFAGWVWRRFWLDDIPGRSAQLSYYFLLSLFPLLIFLSALLGYFFAADTKLERRLIDYLGSMMPNSAFEIVQRTMTDLLEERGGAKLSFGLLLALWMAASGMEAVIEGLNVAFQVREVRPWWRRRLVALNLTVAVAVLSGCALGLALVGGTGGKFVMDLIGPSGLWMILWRVAHGIGSAFFLLFAIALIYFLGPNLRGRRRTQVIMPGAVVALACWITASAGLQLYLDRFSTFGATYGSLGAVIALLLWLYLSGATLLLGAEINSGIQARLD